MMRGWATMAGLLLCGACAVPVPAAGLRMLFADVEGGQATLVVAPSGESLLIDTGWPGNDGRDAKRIVALCERAGVRRIDTVLLTHFHVDHAGGLPQLAALLPIGRVVDHGDNTEPASQDPATFASWQAYQAVLAERRIPRQTVRVGDVLPMRGVRVEVVSAGGRVLERSLRGPGAGEANGACAGSPQKKLRATENDQSVGVVLTFGRLRVLDLGDLTWGPEMAMVCPVNRLGRMDLYVVSHHGMEMSGSPALVGAIRPRVAVMDNGATKGGGAGTFATLAAPAAGGGVLWQLHTADGVPAGVNAPVERIANPTGTDGSWLEVDGARSGAMVVTNGRTGRRVTYRPR